MMLHMLFHVTLLAKFSTADWTLKRPLPFMHACMIQEAPCLIEFLFAVVVLAYYNLSPAIILSINAKFELVAL